MVAKFRFERCDAREGQGPRVADIERRMRMLHRPMDGDNTVVVIEHKLDVIAEADWIIGAGPESGDAKGRIVAQDSPESLVKHRAGCILRKCSSIFLSRTEPDRRFKTTRLDLGQHWMERPRAHRLRHREPAPTWTCWSSAWILRSTLTALPESEFLSGVGSRPTTSTRRLLLLPEGSDMKAKSTDLQPRAIGSLALARRAAVRVAVSYVALVGAWILLQNGIPMSLFIAEADPLSWSQLFVGWFFIISTGWLLFLLMNRGLTLIAEGQEALRLRDRAIESSTNAMIIVEYRRPNLPIISVNPAFERITGYSSAEALGRNPSFLEAAGVDQPELDAVRLAVKEQRSCHVVLRSFRKDGTLYWNDLQLAPVRDDHGLVTHYVAVLNDITETRKYQEELARRANYDTLTGLPNRNLLADRAERAIVRAKRYGHGMVMTFIDLDNFRVINDSLGHAVGDNILRLVGERLACCLREVDTVAHVGGDEFVLVFGEQDSERAIYAELQRIMNVFVLPFELGEREFFVTASVGIATYPMDADKVETLLQHAEIAMYRAKDAGRNTFQFFKAEMTASVHERLALESWMRRAVQRGELVLHYQPQVDLRTNRMFGAEVLVRWQHPKLGLISPEKFIPLAEQTGLIVSIGEWVLRTACAQNRAWQDAGLPPISVAVNISARQFRERNLVAVVAHIVKESGLDPRYVELEVTESVIMQNVDEVVKVLQRLKSLGLTLSIDDFGTGYSSLSYLKRFPVDRLKIDRSFVRDVASDPDGAAITRAVINLGHDLNLRVIAEGVETKEQLDFLNAHQCDERQGYLFSRPLPAQEFEALLRQGETPTE
ncbi:MAG: hypothetical protein A3G25_16830 [Betaproteobacteria bacterium RIFCSPLOWO2_12_FULL_63_13]|nr:MAG: hypothetical protein A3H32_05115 [Betaproteobacteria bacterium RIFCSPLOWO2_02_FULL_63_19]OGA47709.1 MAG: hypothetical protein A3G25_16830 [Betaproteobacteria bacterium RIFCSPLOWO2_12_FULL_63_13]